jgi:hypothetical protein
MPDIAKGNKQLNLTFPADLITAAQKEVDGRKVSLTFEIEKLLRKLAGWEPLKSPRKPGRKKNPEKS